ncbi:copper-transporting ATPase [Cellulomonas sp. JZ18]|uniref:heavy-metal-associated domain-containing protein n=1 Tax=Cellulomonas sp. JZ18 TaxID=2654191 RepID=UPI0012D3D1B6|nr:heavy-metal-associated domain-containing protein [Cellulomonas sp. JZ18]QGQ19427.1 copper-transporting ATPase [Cellulomonas sp. JZ18]
MLPATPRTFVGTATVRVADVVCGHCLDAVQASVRQVAGIRSVTVDHAARTLTVVADEPVDRADLDAAVARTGHAAVPLR